MTPNRRGAGQHPLAGAPWQVPTADGQLSRRAPAGAHLSRPPTELAGTCQYHSCFRRVDDAGATNRDVCFRPRRR